LLLPSFRFLFSFSFPYIPRDGFLPPVTPSVQNQTQQV
jgi:hypothetical protein